MNTADTVDAVTGQDHLARIGSALLHAISGDPTLLQRLPRRVIDAIDLHDTAS